MSNINAKTIPKYFEYMAEAEAKLIEAMERNGLPNYPCPALDYYKAMMKSKVSQQMTLDEWLTSSSVENKPTPAASNTDFNCNHEWKLYQGLLHDDYFCTVCNAVKPLKDGP